MPMSARIRLTSCGLALLLAAVWMTGRASADPSEGQDPAPTKASAKAAKTRPDAADGDTVAQITEEEYRAEEEEAATRGIGGFFQRSSDNITSQLMTSWRGVSGLVGGPITQVGEAWRDFNERQRYLTRLDLGLAYTALYQSATTGRSPTSVAAGDFDFFGSWHLVGLEGSTAGRLGFQTEYRHDFGRGTPSTLNRSFGSILRTTSGFNTHDFTLRQLWWQQELADGRLMFRAGKITQSDFFSTGRFRSANFFFLNQAFASALAVPFPDSGLGAVGFAFPREDLYVGVGFGEADPEDTQTGFSNFFEDNDFFTAAEVGFLTDLDGLGPGTYRFTFSHTDGVEDAGQPSGWSLSLSFDQQLGEQFVPFFRYSFTDRAGLTTISQIMTAGVGVLNPFGNEGDVCGLAFAWAQPDERNLDDEYVIEAFYRIQLTPTLQITPDYQIIIDPAFNPKEDVVGVFGLRFRIQF
jgi:porin